MAPREGAVSRKFHERKPKKMTRGVRLLLSLVAVFIVAQVAVPRQAHATEQSQSIESLLLDANHERDYISERNVRTAVPAEVSSRIAPPSARTSVWRGRTHASGTFNAYPLVLSDFVGQAQPFVFIAEAVLFTSRAADYYIYALRHIII